MKCMYIWKLGSIHSVYLVNKIEVMDEESGVIEVLCCTIMASASVLFNETQHVGKRKRTCWVKNYFKERNQYGASFGLNRHPCLDQRFSKMYTSSSSHSKSLCLATDFLNTRTVNFRKR